MINLQREEAEEGAAGTAKRNQPLAAAALRDTHQFMFFPWYCWQVTSGTPPALCTHAFAAFGSPPWQLPASPQLITSCTEGITSRPLPFEAILIRSAREDIGAWAQQEPQSERVQCRPVSISQRSAVCSVRQAAQ